MDGRRGRDPGSERPPSFTDTQPWEKGVGLLGFQLTLLLGAYGWAMLVEDRLPDWAVLTGILIWTGVALVLFKLGPYWWWAWRGRSGRSGRSGRRGRHAMVPVEARTDRDQADRRAREEADRREHEESVARELERLRRVHAVAMGEHDVGEEPARDPGRDPGDHRDGD